MPATPAKIIGNVRKIIGNVAGGESIPGFEASWPATLLNGKHNMPIAYSCPHCGKQFSVAEQYAGQTGPCAGCGQPITIPPASGGPGYAYAPHPAKGGSMGVVVGVLVACAIGGFCVIGILVALLLPAVQAAREAARRMQASNHLKQLGLAMQNYHDEFGSFPPAFVADADGKPLYSGRVLLLPFMEEKPLYDQFDKTQAWNSPTNLPLTSQAPIVFRDPSARIEVVGQTDFLFVTGKGTAMPDEHSRGLAAIVDGTSNTLEMVEVKNSGINWAEPRDLDFSQPISLPPGNHPNVNLALFFDGHTQAIVKNTPPQVIRALSTCAGGESIPDF
jgi:type II secretory pathway pseudopilin PulG